MWCSDARHMPEQKSRERSMHWLTHVRCTAVAAGARPTADAVSTAVGAAQDAFWRHTGVPPAIILRLAAAQHQQLAVLGRVPRLLRMLTAGIWALAPGRGGGQPQDPRQRLHSAAGPGRPPVQQQQQPDWQQAQQVQQGVLAACHAQLALGGELLSRYGGAGMAAATGASAGVGSRPGSGGGALARGTSPGPGAAAAAAAGANPGVVQWVGEMEKVHGAHWLLAALRQLAREAGGAAAGTQPQPRPASGRAGGVAAAQAGQQAGALQRLPPQMLDVAKWAALATGRAARPGLQPQQPPLLAPSEARVGPLQQEADALLDGLRAACSSSGQVGAAQAAPGAGLLAAAWQAAEQLAAWAHAAAPTVAGLAAASNGAGGTQALQERAMAAVASLFLLHSSLAAAASGQEAGGGEGYAPAGTTAVVMEALLRLGELLERRCK